jgi:hypothetical protein
MGTVDTYPDVRIQELKNHTTSFRFSSRVIVIVNISPTFSGDIKNQLTYQHDEVRGVA